MATLKLSDKPFSEMTEEEQKRDDKILDRLIYLANQRTRLEGLTYGHTDSQ